MLQARAMSASPLRSQSGKKTLRKPAAARTSRPAAEAAEVCFSLMEMQRRHFADAAEALGFSPPQAVLLWHVSRLQPCSMGALSSSLHCDPSNITGLVDKLERRGLLSRQPSEEDRRVKRLTLTAEGRQAARRLLLRLRRPAGWMLALSPEDQVLLRDLLRRAVANLAGTER